MSSPKRMKLVDVDTSVQTPTDQLDGLYVQYPSLITLFNNDDSMFELFRTNKLWYIRRLQYNAKHCCNWISPYETCRKYYEENGCDLSWKSRNILIDLKKFNEYFTRWGKINHLTLLCAIQF